MLAPSGASVGGRVSQPAPDVLAVAVHAVEKGTYRVVWSGVSADTHPARGAFTFSVAFAGPPPPDTTPAVPGTVALVLQALARTASLAGLVLALGTAPALLAWHSGDTLRGPVRAGVALLVIAVPLHLLAALVALPGSTVAGVLASPFGRVLALRAGVAGIAWAVTGEHRRQSWGLTVLLPAAAVVEALGAHRQPGWPAFAAPVPAAVHVLTGILFAGGVVAAIALTRRPSIRIAAAVAMLLSASGVLLFAGHASLAPASWLRGGYATLVAAKAALGAVALAAGAVFAVVGGRGVRRMEVAAVATVLALAALVTAMQPAR